MPGYYLRGMYKIVTKYTLLGLRRETDHSNHVELALRPIPGVPAEFNSEQAALDWALSNHDDFRHYPEFIVQAVRHMVLTDPQ